MTGPGAGLVRFEGTNQLRWTRQQGLPSDDTGTVTVGTGRRGLVCGRSAEGVVRFDGTNFFRLTQKDGLPAGVITSIRVVPDGRVWFGTDKEPWRALMAGASPILTTSSAFTGRTDGAANRQCWDIQQGPDGATWFGTTDRLWRFEEDTFRQYSTADGLPEGGVSSLLAAPDGALIGACRHQCPGHASTASGSGRTRCPSRPPACSPARTGQIYAALASTPPVPERIAILQGGSILSVLTNSAGQPGNAFTCLARAADGALWAGSASNGVVRFAGTDGVATLVRTNGLLTNSINAIHCDARGAVWIATDGRNRPERRNQLDRVHPRRTALRAGSWTAIESGPDGSVWFGAWDGGLARFDGKTMKPVASSRGTFIPSSVQNIFRAADGTLWFATVTGVTRYDGTTWVPLDEGDGLLPGVLGAIAQDANGGMWFGSENGLTRYEPVVATNPMPAVLVQTDQVYTNLQALPHITAGRLVTFKVNAVDFRTRPEKRLYRYAVVPGRVDSAPAKTNAAWQPATRTAELEWPSKSAGEYTFFAQSIDRDLNYSTPAVAHLTIVPPWFANAWIMVPSGGVLLGLVGWAFVARSLVIRRKREAEQLREQMLEQERQARVHAWKPRTRNWRRPRKPPTRPTRPRASFLANMSHELRTPLNAIIGYSEMLQEEAEDLGQKEFIPDLRKIHGAGKHLLGLINDILDLSKIEAGKMTLYLEDFDVAKLVQRSGRAPCSRWWPRTATGWKWIARRTSARCAPT